MTVQELDGKGEAQSSDRGAHLNEKLNKNLAAYAAAAGAAGVGILALAQPAHADIISTRVSITVTTPENGVTAVPIFQVDGVGVLGLQAFGYVGHLAYDNFIEAEPGNHVLFGGSNSRLGPYAARLAKGAVIGRGEKFGGALLAYSTYGGGGKGQGGLWPNQSGYLGFEFSLDGQHHLGWAKLDVSAVGLIVSATVTEYPGTRCRISRSSLARPSPVFSATKPALPNRARSAYSRSDRLGSASGAGRRRSLL